MGQKWAAEKGAYSVQYAEYSVCGRRNEMEDAFIADVVFGREFPRAAKEKGMDVSSVSAITGSLFGVFDGHSGAKCSSFVSKNLPLALFKNSNYPNDPALALKEAFFEVDKKFLEGAKSKKLKDGSTGLVALALHERLFVANVGDSRGVLCHASKAIPMSRDHKPNEPDELARIVKHGGTVTNDSESGIPRINGKLAVSRGFGDLKFKNAETLGEKFVTVEAEVMAVPITTETQFLLLACDGFWDVITNDESVAFVLEKLKVKTQPYDQKALYEISIELTTLAYNKGSTDNISIVLISFDHSPPPNPNASGTNIQRTNSKREGSLGGKGKRKDSADPNPKTTEVPLDKVDVKAKETLSNADDQGEDKLTETSRT
jgi:protein phosphatase 1L